MEPHQPNLAHTVAMHNIATAEAEKRTVARDFSNYMERIGYDFYLRAHVRGTMSQRFPLHSAIFSKYTLINSKLTNARNGTHNDGEDFANSYNGDSGEDGDEDRTELVPFEGGGFPMISFDLQDIPGYITGDCEPFEMFIEHAYLTVYTECTWSALYQDGELVEKDDRIVCEVAHYAHHAHGHAMCTRLCKDRPDFDSRIASFAVCCSYFGFFKGLVHAVDIFLHLELPHLNIDESGPFGVMLALTDNEEYMHLNYKLNRLWRARRANFYHRPSELYIDSVDGDTSGESESVWLGYAPHRTNLITYTIPPIMGDDSLYSTTHYAAVIDCNVEDGKNFYYAHTDQGSIPKLAITGNKQELVLKLYDIVYMVEYNLRAAHRHISPGINCDITNNFGVEMKHYVYVKESTIPRHVLKNVCIEIIGIDDYSDASIIGGFVGGRAMECIQVADFTGSAATMMRTCNDNPNIIKFVAESCNILETAHGNDDDDIWDRALKSRSTLQISLDMPHRNTKFALHIIITHL